MSSSCPDCRRIGRRDLLRAGGLSARGLHKVTRVARTVAALDGADEVSFAHTSEALSLRAGRAVVVA